MSGTYRHRDDPLLCFWFAYILSLFVRFTVLQMFDIAWFEPTEEAASEAGVQSAGSCRGKRLLHAPAVIT